MKKLKTLIPVIIFCSLISCLMNCDISFAATGMSTEVWTIDLGTANPGETISGKFNVKNSGDESYSYKTTVDPYSFIDEGKDVSFSEKTDFNRLSEWITLEQESGSLSPRESQYVNFTIKIPENAPAGDQYAAIHPAALASYDDSNISTMNALPSVAIIVSIRVNGETIESGKVLENNVPSFIFNPPINVSSTIENTGNVSIKSTYFLQVFPLFSNEEVYTNEENPETATIFPESKRYVSQSWDSAPSLGIFKVKQTIKFLNQESVNEKIVLICPMWLLIIISLFVICMIIWCSAKTRKRKEQNGDKK